MTSPIVARPAFFPQAAPAGDPAKYLRQIDDKLTAKPSDIKPKAIDTAAHDFMKKAGLIKPGEESNDGVVRSRWKVDRVIRFGDKDLAVMNLAVGFFDGQQWADSNGDAWEVVAVTKKPAGGYQFARFEDAIPLPPTLRAGIGVDQRFPGEPTIRQQMYYVELSGKSVAEALKSVFTKTFTPGFNGYLIAGGGGKAAFDPTPGRTWKVKNPSFDMRRGGSAEALDVQAWFLDKDFKGYYKGSGGHVAPWSASVLKVLVDGKWRDSLPKTGVPAAGGIGPL